MSMISAQCDELRRIADKDTVPYEASDAMYQAADTIWELRCKLAGVVDQSDEIKRLKDKNARLRSCLSDDAENARLIMGENAKLRELVKNLYECNGSCERCVELMGRCEYKEQLMELGIEVEDA